MDNYEDLIIKMAEQFRLDANLIRAIMTVESGFEPWRTRTEPAYRYLVNPSDYAAKLGVTQLTEETNQKTSFGLGQIMGALARDLGFTDHLTMLCMADVGAFYCAKNLRRLMDKYGDEEKVVASYNAGSPRMTDGGMYENQAYINKVYTELRKYRKLV